MGTWENGIYIRTLKEQYQEIEANYFATLLLMPSGLFQEEMQRARQREKDEDAAIISLAKVFKVPLFAVVIRLQILYKYRV